MAARNRPAQITVNGSIVADCKLCQKRAKLCDSHIIPEFCYKPSYDPKHRALVVKSESRETPWIQKGLREPLLCQECENHLSKIEGAFKKYWFDGKALPSPVNSESVTVQRPPYAIFKLFHLSILWRASVASSDPFGTVHLGPYEDKLRHRILANDPGNPECFPFFGQVIVADSGSPEYAVVSGAYVSRLDNMRAYYMCYAGCEWTFLITESCKLDYKTFFPRPTSNLSLRTVPLREINTIQMLSRQRATLPT